MTRNARNYPRGNNCTRSPGTGVSVDHWLFEGDLDVLLIANQTEAQWFGACLFDRREHFIGCPDFLAVDLLDEIVGLEAAAYGQGSGFQRDDLHATVFFAHAEGGKFLALQALEADLHPDG